jgi:hypothetical protein
VVVRSVPSGLRRTAARLVVACVATLAGVPSAVPSAAAWSLASAGSPTAPGASSGSGISGTSGTGEGQPTQAEAQAAQAAAAAAHAQVDRQAGQLDLARASLASAASAAGLALERYRSAVLALQQAQQSADQTGDALADVDAQLRTAQEALGRWVRQAYGNGGLLTGSPTAMTLLSGGDLDGVDLARVVLERNGSATHQALMQVVRTQAAWQAAADAADDAQRAAGDAAVRAATAKAEADAAVNRQQAAVDQLQAGLTGAQDTAAQADQRAARLTRARALADAGARAWGNQVTGPVGSCSGRDVSGYANGTIPLTDLCPLWGAPGAYLRADAAYAFSRLSQAYAAVFGTSVCVTDSYRSYPEQVRVYAEKPQLAAVPGTSNHGWGTAADLCGGIESFDTETHRWMLLNAPSYGWFHPAWAEPDGSRPEPWHWEFAG